MAGPWDKRPPRGDAPGPEKSRRESSGGETYRADGPPRAGGRGADDRAASHRDAPRRDGSRAYSPGKGGSRPGEQAPPSARRLGGSMDAATRAARPGPSWQVKAPPQAAVRGVSAPGSSGEPVEASRQAPRPSRKEEVRLYGLNAIQAVFDRRPDAIRKVYLLQSRVHALKRLLAWCVQNRVGYRVVEEDDLERLTGSGHHEGVAADVLRVEPLSLAGWLDAQPADAPRLAIWLDGVSNPHNFGAILRSAAHFGAAILLPAGSSLAVSGAAARVSEGGAESVTLVRLPEAAQAIVQLRQAGFELAATVVQGGEDLFAVPAATRRVYVMGAEGEGMDAALAAACDRRLSIPGTGAVESLNVAAATAVFLARWVAERARD